MPKLFTYIHAHTANPFLYGHKNHFVSIIASSDDEARTKLNSYPLVFVSQKPLRRIN